MHTCLQRFALHVGFAVGGLGHGEGLTEHSFILHILQYPSSGVWYRPLSKRLQQSQKEQAKLDWNNYSMWLCSFLCLRKGFVKTDSILTILDAWVGPPNPVNRQKDFILNMTAWFKYAYVQMWDFKLHLKPCFPGLSEWPCRARSAGSRNAADTAGHRNASSPHATAQTPSGSPVPYSSRSAPPSGYSPEIQGFQITEAKKLVKDL